MTTITATRTVSMGHRLPSYKGLCSSPHGHNMKIEVEVRVPLDAFLDFKQVDRDLAILADTFDHAMLLQNTDPLAEVLLNMGFRVLTFIAEPTTEHIAHRVFRHMMNAGYDVQHVTIYETDKYSATVSA